MNQTFTSESVCAGHPDKICDQISDAIVDSALSQDKYARVAVETLVTRDKTILAGEVTLAGEIDYENVAKGVIRKLGYTDDKLGYSDRSPISVFIHKQSQTISDVVDKAGAGDQGIMYGYATNETAEFMPTPIVLSHTFAHEIDRLRESKKIPYLRPDGKTQVTIQYKDGKPYKILNIVLAAPHKENVTPDQVKEDFYENIIVPMSDKFGFALISRENVYVNGGPWYIGGPASDTGVTGRKIIVDSYGSFARVGGGAFSGKDPTKVDRSMAYFARYIAKNIVAHGLADKVETRLAFTFGGHYPLMSDFDTFGTSKSPNNVIVDFVKSLVGNLSVSEVIDFLELRNPIYLATAAYGHFGREDFPWEKIRA
ncbi:MAG: methionine adenosyltransferase [Candidatus Dojkabacteria bacterium]|nr:MAG: methionine adenosyltransferase [Candidatus Dojkabacteria bacterium]